MLIHVLYHDGKYDMVKDRYLGSYIDSGRILKFKRKDGWVTIGVDPIRESDRTYIGPERRKVE